MVDQNVDLENLAELNKLNHRESFSPGFCCVVILGKTQMIILWSGVEVGRIIERDWHEIYDGNMTGFSFSRR